jgi:Clp amino terminal domain, pathogenicity island component/Peptidase S24-like
MPRHYDPATIRSQLVRSNGRLPDPHFRTRLPSLSITRSHPGPRTSFWDPHAQGDWSYLFVQQLEFKRALKGGVATLAGLAAHIGGAPPATLLETILTDGDAPEEQRFVTLLPVYSLAAAAGYFGAGEHVECEGWVEVGGTLDENMFVARAVGNSMEQRIHDGDLCVFRARPAGTRQGKILLVRYQGPTDPETGGSYTVKRYHAEKVVDGEIASALESPTLEAEHLLLAVARQPSTTAQGVLAEAGLGYDQVRDALDVEFEGNLAAVGVSLRLDLSRPPLGTSAKLALERAAKIADTRRNRRITPGHILLGILKPPPAPSLVHSSAPELTGPSLATESQQRFRPPASTRLPGRASVDDRHGLRTIY